MMEKTFLLLILFLLIPNIANAEYLGCFEPSETVYATVQFNGSTGEVAATSVLARVLDPNDTTTPTATPTMSAVDGTNAVGLFRGSFSVGASPLAGTWTIRYKGTVDGYVQAGTDTFHVVDTTGDCASRTGVVTASGTITSVTNGVTVASGGFPVGGFASGAITADAIAAGAITSSEAPNLDAAISTRATPAQVNTEVDTAIIDARLDELLFADSDIDGAAPPTVGSVVHEMLTKTTGSFTYDQTTDSLEAITDGGPALIAAIADAVWDETATGHISAGKAGEQLWTDVDAILTDTADMQPKLGTPAGASMSVDIAAIEAQTDDIGVAGAGLTAIDLPNQTMDITGNLSGSVGSVTGAVGSVTGNVGGNVVGSVASVTAIVTANVTQVSGDSVAADNLELAYDGTGYAGQAIKVTIDTANTDTWDTIQIDETGIITVDGQYVGAYLWCGTEVREIVATDYQAAADDTITVEPGRPFGTAPAGLSTCYIGAR